MTKEDKIKALEELQNIKGELTTKQKELRDAIWVSEIELSESWKAMRDKHIEDIVDNSVKNKSFWIAEQNWNEMYNNDKEKFLQEYNDKNNELIGNTIMTKVKLQYRDGEKGSIGIYYTYLKSAKIEIDTADTGNFYNTINTITHEGSGHGFQDYVLRNKAEYLKNNPKQNDDIRIFELSSSKKTKPNSGLSWYMQSYDVYRSNPVEKDAWYMGNTIEKNLLDIKNSKVGDKK